MEMAVEMTQEQSIRPLIRANPRESRGRKANEANAFRQESQAGRVAGGKTGRSAIRVKMVRTSVVGDKKIGRMCGLYVHTGSTSDAHDSIGERGSA